jgi:hypothetical protein
VHGGERAAAAARAGENLMPFIEAVRCYTTLGEIIEALVVRRVHEPIII